MSAARPGPLQRAISLVARNVVLPLVDVAIRRSPAALREYVFREAALDLGVSTITCGGELGTFEGDARDRVVHAAYVSTRTWAPEFQTLVRERVFAAGGGTLVDVGANIGLTCIPIAVARGVTCYGFEPDPTNFRLLTRNIAANDAGARVTAFNLALMDQDGSFDFERSGDNMGDHRIRVSAGNGGGAGRGGAPERAGAYGEQARTVVKVEARRLDAVLAGRPMPGPVLLKVDVQGAEVRVLQGATAILPAVDLLFIEYWPYGLARMGDTAAALLEVVSGFAYGCVMAPTGAPPFEPIAELLARVRRDIPMDGSRVDHLDLLLSRRATL